VVGNIAQGERARASNERELSIVSLSERLEESPISEEQGND